MRRTAGQLLVALIGYMPRPLAAGKLIYDVELAVAAIHLVNVAAKATGIPWSHPEETKAA